MDVNIVKQLKKYSIIGFLLLSFTISMNAHAAETTEDLSWMQEISGLVEDYGWMFSIGSAIVSTISARKHDAMNRKFFLQILSAIAAVNRKLDVITQRIIGASCNIYKHGTYANYNSFQVIMKNYLSTSPDNRHNNMATLHDLSLYLPALISKFEDHQNLLQPCLRDPHKTLGLYLLLSNIDLSIQADHVRQTNYIRYRSNGQGPLTPLDQMDVNTKATMDFVIENEIKDRLLVRLNAIITHLMALDGQFLIPSWSKASDKRFVFDNLNAKSVTKNFRFSYDDFKIRYGNYMDKIIVFHQPLEKYTGLVVEVSEKNKSMIRMTIEPGFVSEASNYSIFSVEFDFLNDPGFYYYYQNKPEQLYRRFADHKYIELVQSELIPAVKLVNQWITEVGHSTLREVPNLTAINDAQNYDFNKIYYNLN